MCILSVGAEVHNGNSGCIALGSPLETFRLLAANKRAMERLTPAVKLILIARGT